jgi:hypothetical protein
MFWLDSGDADSPKAVSEEGIGAKGQGVGHIVINGLKSDNFKRRVLWRT